MQSRIIISLMGIGVLMASACVVEDRSDPPVASGSLELDWTINGTDDPNQCNQASASSMSISVYDDSGAYVNAFDASCQAFATSIELAEGRYTATAALLDSSGRARTTTINVAPFRIIAGTSLSVPVDFPANSFY